MLALLQTPAAAQSSYYSQSGATFTSPNNVPPPASGPTYDYLDNILYVGAGAPGSFSSIAGAQMTGAGLVLAIGGTGVGSATLTGAGNVTQLTGAGQARLEVGSWGVGTLTISGGALVNAAVANAACSPTSFCGSFVGNGAGSTGSLTITGAGSELRTLQSFVVGAAGVYTQAVNGYDFGTPGGTTNAVVNVNAGGTLNTQFANVGVGPNTAAALGTERGNGTVIVDGANSRWLVGPNTVNNTAAGISAGANVGGNGTITVRNGAQLRVDGTNGPGPNDFINLGSNGGKATLTVTGTGSNVTVQGKTPVINVGRSGAGGQGTFNVLAGASADSLYLNVGRDGASGAALVDGNGSQVRLVGTPSAPGSLGAGSLVGGGGGDGQLTISNGGNVLISDGGFDTRNQSGSLGMTVARETGSTGQVTVTGAGSTLQMSSSSISPSAGSADNYNPGLILGRDAGANGSMTISAGGKVLLQGNAVSTTTFSRTTAVNIGGSNDNAAGGTGSMLVTGAGSELRVSGSDAFIGVGRGSGSVGSLRVEQGGSVSTTNMSVGRGAGGSGTLVVDNASLAFSGQHTGNFQSGAGLTIGTGSGSGSATIGNGSVVSMTNPGSAGTFVTVGGSGNFPLGTGSLAISGGSQLTMAAAPGLATFTVGRDGTGTASITGASTVDIGDGAAYVGRFAGSTGTMLVQQGSTFTSGYFGVGRNTSGDGGTGTLILDNSTLNATTLEVGTNGYLGGNGGVINATDIVVHGTLGPGDSPGTIVINRGNFRTGSGHLILDVQTNGSGGYLVDNLDFSLGTTFAFPGVEVTFNFIGGTDVGLFAASGQWDMDTFLRSLDPSTGATTGLSSVFAPGQTWETVLASATFDVVDNGRPIETLDINPDGTFNVVAVPEPETWALLVGGLGLLAAAGRRRRARRVD